jgi:internalin A
MAENNYQFDNAKAAFAEGERRIKVAVEAGAAWLDLSGLGLMDLPESIGKLTHLEILHATDNRLTTLPETISRLTSLVTLSLYRNKLKSLPASVGRLTKLRELHLDENELTELPDTLGRLTQLEELWLHSNKLLFLPESLRELTALQKLFLHRNDSLGLPPDVLGLAPWERGDDLARPADILDYYFRVRVGKRPLNEAKLILLGRGEVGKTALVNRLVRNEFKRTNMTRGIAITQWSVTTGKDTVRLNVWDFGGQEIQHATHQFFLTERSLYLVVLNGRAGAEDDDAEYWLKFIKTFGGSSPTIVVLNKFKVQPFEVNRRGLQEKYPFIRGFVETDCKPKTENGRTELIKNTKSALEAMEYVRADFPADWFKIKERLAQMQELGESFISFDEYRKICEELGEKDWQAQERLAGFLNALGIALNFREDQQLREETVLNPHWITDGVYQIITSKVLAEKKGELRLADLTLILRSKKNYPARMHGFLIELMRKFELCFPYQDDPKERRYLVPELLGKEKPALKDSFIPDECLNFRYDYRLMPEGLLPRFITRTHTMSDRAERWRTGAVLRWEGCRALVEADKQERQVLVRVVGEADKRLRLLAVIRENFDKIHAEMKEFKPTEWVALEEDPKRWVSFAKLETFERNREHEFKEDLGDRLVTVNVNEILERTDVPGARQKPDARIDGKRPLKLFISYAHEDESWRAKLNPNLDLLQREGLVELWYDLKIIPGHKWDEEIKKKLNEADLYVFLMSTDLLVSDYVRDTELPIARQRHDANHARLVPVVVRKCSWKRYVGDIQALPDGAKSVKEWTDKDQAFFNVEEGLRKAIDEMRKKVDR